MKIDFSKPLETVLGEPVKYICSDVVEYKSARICVDDDGVVYSSPYIGIQIRNVKEEWTGEGRPPVGVPVEYQLRGASNGEWYPTQINFLSGQHVIYCDNDGDEVRNNPSEVKFRPIRTPEQIAAEEREKTIAELKKVFDSISHELCQTSNKYLETLFGAIHDAGWKQVKP